MLHFFYLEPGDKARRQASGADDTVAYVREIGQSNPWPRFQHENTRKLLV